MGNSTSRDMNEMADPNNNGDYSDLREDGLPENKCALDLPYDDEVPEDIKAFFGHPLTAAETALHGDALALLHEYQHLPSLDKADLRLNDKYELFNDILRGDVRREIPSTTSEYMTLMSSDVFLSRDGECSSTPGLSVKILDDDAASQKEQSNPEDLLGGSQKAVGSDDFETFDRDDPLNLSLPIKQEELARDTAEELLEAIRSVSPTATATASELEASLTVSHAGLAMTNNCSPIVKNCNGMVTAVAPHQPGTAPQLQGPDLKQPPNTIRLPPRLIHMPPPPPGHVYVPTQRLLGPPPPGYVAIPAGFNPRHIFPHEVLIPHGMRPPLDSQLQPMVPVAVAPTVHYSPGHTPTSTPKTVSLTPPPPLLRALSAPPQTIQVQQNVINTTSTSPTVQNNTPPPPKYEDVRPQNQTIVSSSDPSEHHIKTEEEVGPDQRPSDSTKRIIQALNDKLRKKQRQKQPSESDDCVSLQEITNIINESMCEDDEENQEATTHSTVSEITKCLNSAPKLESAVVNWDVNGMQWSPSRQNSVTSDAGHAVAMGSSRLSPVSPSSSTAPPTPSPSDAVCHALVISPQTQLLQPSSAAGHPTYSDLKSPDSGFNECCTDNCVSPADSNNNNMTPTAFADTTSGLDGNLGLGGIESGREKIGKRRRSSTSSSIKSVCGSKGNSSITAIPKLERNVTGFNYYMETGISTSQRMDEDRITYLNKGQFYGLSMEYQPSERILKSSTVKTVIMVVFREERNRDDELKSWGFWHSRQHSTKHRILDIDTKVSSGVLPGCIQEIAHNAVALRWNPREQTAKVSVAINCLSTDFSNQKGVKGQPLHIQIDTYEEPKDSIPIHRGYCQIKIFCDKGAERKTRDEERRKDAKTKLADMNGRKRPDDLFHPLSERSEFYSMADLTFRPILFRPDDDQFRSHMSDGLARLSSREDSDDDYMGALCSPRKRMRSLSYDLFDNERVLLYVRNEQESVYTALLLNIPTLVGLTHAIEEKYKIPAASIENAYKRSRKGILVKMDDNIIRHYSNESTFIISFNSRSSNDDVVYDVTLAEVDHDST